MDKRRNWLFADTVKGAKASAALVLFDEIFNEGIEIGIQKAAAVDLSNLRLKVMKLVLLHRMCITLGEQMVVTSAHLKSPPQRKVPESSCWYPWWYPKVDAANFDRR